MVGMLAGVVVASRRRAIRHHRLPLHDTPFSERIEPSRIWAITMDMDETALKARRRLEQKLGCFRSSTTSTHDGGSCNHIGRRKQSGLGSKILGRPWHFHLNSNKSDREVCAVCLEDLGAEKKQVMNLSCSHKYHSKCLLPWLSAHPHCPYCRSPVQSLF